MLRVQNESIGEHPRRLAFTEEYSLEWFAKTFPEIVRYLRMTER